MEPKNLTKIFGETIQKRGAFFSVFSHILLMRYIEK